MRFMRSDSSYDYDAYFRYVASLRTQLPKSLRVFAANEGNYNLSDPNSLHDSRLIEWRIRDVLNSEDPATRLINIDARFLGPRHDREIVLSYRNVRSYEVRMPESYNMPPYHSGHGDLLMHEVIMQREGLFSHQLLFSRGTTQIVAFTEFSHAVQELRNFN